MKQQVRSALIAIATQYFAVVLGVYWGWAGVFLRQPWLVPRGWPVAMFYQLPIPKALAGWLAVVALGVEGIRLLSTPRLRPAHPSRIWLCFSLSCYLVWLMFIEPFYWYLGDITFVSGVLWLTPLLFAMSSLVRWRAWIGLAGAVVFFATGIAMMIQNACSRGGMTGFFEAVVF